ncbi:MAG: biopolymer transporter ExbD [Candidatus Omnitrophica bacterium]|jgi:biopolymer transport protein ExbD|nr:biopolymer transporter ExbD [Candidatus Omnitrophota bacterium]
MIGKNRVKQKLVAEINITPFTDVILVLLIIFMITTPLILQSNIRVNLPSATSAESANQSSQASITVTNEGLVYLDDQIVSRKTLKPKLQSMFKANPELEVVLFSDRMVRFKDIVGLLDIFNELGIRHMNIAARTE